MLEYFTPRGVSELHCFIEIHIQVLLLTVTPMGLKNYEEYSKTASVYMNMNLFNNY